MRDHPASSPSLLHESTDKLPNLIGCQIKT
jgi:hypothetical protein